MSWLAPSPGRRPPWLGRLLLRALGLRRAPSASARLWARAPRPFAAFLALYRAVDRAGSPLEARLRALVMVRVSQVNGCAFCADLTGARALARGATPAHLDALPHHAVSALFTARERAALALADAVTPAGGAVPPALRQALRAAFDEDAIVELVALIAFQGLSSTFNAALDVPPEGACRHPGLAPRRAAGGG